MTWHPVSDAARVAQALGAPASAVPVRVAGRSLIITRDAHDELRALSNECPHQGATVCRAAQTGQDTVECPNHYWVFDLAGTFQGSRLALAAGRTAPADPAKDLPSYPCRDVDGVLQVLL